MRKVKVLKSHHDSLKITDLCFCHFYLLKTPKIYFVLTSHQWYKPRGNGRDKPRIQPSKSQTKVLDLDTLVHDTPTCESSIH